MDIHTQKKRNVRSGKLSLGGLNFVVTTAVPKDQIVLATIDVREDTFADNDAIPYLGKRSYHRKSNSGGKVVSQSKLRWVGGLRNTRNGAGQLSVEIISPVSGVGQKRNLRRITLRDGVSVKNLGTKSQTGGHSV